MQKQKEYFWSWSFKKNEDAEQQLARACAAYRQRWGREPSVVFLHPTHNGLLKRSHLVVVANANAPRNLFCFTPGDTQ